MNANKNPLLSALLAAVAALRRCSGQVQAGQDTLRLGSSPEDGLQACGEARNGPSSAPMASGLRRMEVRALPVVRGAQRGARPTCRVNGALGQWCGPGSQVREGSMGEVGASQQSGCKVEAAGAACPK
jgi:hypothetical protein